MSMIPFKRVGEASRDFLCDTLTMNPNDPSIPANHTIKLTRNHIMTCDACRDKMDKTSVVQDLTVVKKMVDISIATGLVNNQLNDAEIKLVMSPLKKETISEDKADKLKEIAQHIIDHFVNSYQ